MTDLEKSSQVVVLDERAFQPSTIAEMSHQSFRSPSLTPHLKTVGDSQTGTPGQKLPSVPANSPASDHGELPSFDLLKAKDQLIPWLQKENKRRLAAIAAFHEQSSLATLPIQTQIDVLRLEMKSLGFVANDVYGKDPRSKMIRNLPIAGAEQQTVSLHERRREAGLQTLFRQLDASQKKNAELQSQNDQLQADNIKQRHEALQKNADTVKAILRMQKDFDEVQQKLEQNDAGQGGPSSDELALREAECEAKLEQVQQSRAEARKHYGALASHDEESQHRSVSLEDVPLAEETGTVSRDKSTEEPATKNDLNNRREKLLNQRQVQALANKYPAEAWNWRPTYNQQATDSKRVHKKRLELDDASDSLGETLDRLQETKDHRFSDGYSKSLKSERSTVGAPDQSPKSLTDLESQLNWFGLSLPKQQSSRSSEVDEDLEHMASVKDQQTLQIFRLEIDLAAANQSLQEERQARKELEQYHQDADREILDFFSAAREQNVRLEGDLKRFDVRVQNENVQRLAQSRVAAQKRARTNENSEQPAADTAEPGSERLQNTQSIFGLPGHESLSYLWDTTSRAQPLTAHSLMREDMQASPGSRPRTRYSFVRGHEALTSPGRLSSQSSQKNVLMESPFSFFGQSMGSRTQPYTPSLVVGQIVERPSRLSRGLRTRTKSYGTSPSATKPSPSNRASDIESSFLSSRNFFYETLPHNAEAEHPKFSPQVETPPSAMYRPGMNSLDFATDVAEAADESLDFHRRGRLESIDELVALVRPLHRGRRTSFSTVDERSPRSVSPHSRSQSIQPAPRTASWGVANDHKLSTVRSLSPKRSPRSSSRTTSLRLGDEPELPRAQSQSPSPSLRESSRTVSRTLSDEFRVESLNQGMNQAKPQDPSELTLEQHVNPLPAAPLQRYEVTSAVSEQIRLPESSHQTEFSHQYRNIVCKNVETVAEDLLQPEAGRESVTKPMTRDSNPENSPAESKNTSELEAEIELINVSATEAKIRQSRKLSIREPAAMAGIHHSNAPVPAGNPESVEAVLFRQKAGASVVAAPANDPTYDAGAHVRSRGIAVPGLTGETSGPLTKSIGHETATLKSSDSAEHCDLDEKQGSITEAVAELPSPTLREDAQEPLSACSMNVTGEFGLVSPKSPIIVAELSERLHEQPLLADSLAADNSNIPGQSEPKNVSVATTPAELFTQSPNLMELLEPGAGGNPGSLLVLEANQRDPVIVEERAVSFGEEAIASKEKVVISKETTIPSQEHAIPSREQAIASGEKALMSEAEGVVSREQAIPVVEDSFQGQLLPVMGYQDITKNDVTNDKPGHRVSFDLPSWETKDIKKGDHQEPQALLDTFPEHASSEDASFDTVTPLDGKLIEGLSKSATRNLNAMFPDVAVTTQLGREQSSVPRRVLYFETLRSTDVRLPSSLEAIVDQAPLPSDKLVLQGRTRPVSSFCVHSTVEPPEIKTGTPEDFARTSSPSPDEKEAELGSEASNSDSEMNGEFSEEAQKQSSYAQRSLSTAMSEYPGVSYLNELGRRASVSRTLPTSSTSQASTSSVMCAEPPTHDRTPAVPLPTASNVLTSLDPSPMLEPSLMFGSSLVPSWTPNPPPFPGLAVATSAFAWSRKSLPVDVSHFIPAAVNQLVSAAPVPTRAFHSSWIPDRSNQPSQLEVPRSFSVPNSFAASSGLSTSTSFAEPLSPQSPAKALTYQQKVGGPTGTDHPTEVISTSPVSPEEAVELSIVENETDSSPAFLKTRIGLRESLDVGGQAKLLADEAAGKPLVQTPRPPPQSAGQMLAVRLSSADRPKQLPLEVPDQPSAPMMLLDPQNGQVTIGGDTLWRHKSSAAEIAYHRSAALAALEGQPVEDVCSEEGSYGEENGEEATRTINVRALVRPVAPLSWRKPIRRSAMPAPLRFKHEWKDTRRWAATRQASGADADAPTIPDQRSVGKGRQRVSRDRIRLERGTSTHESSGSSNNLRREMRDRNASASAPPRKANSLSITTESLKHGEIPMINQAQSSLDVNSSQLGDSPVVRKRSERGFLSSLTTVELTLLVLIVANIYSLITLRDHVDEWTSVNVSARKQHYLTSIRDEYWGSSWWSLVQLPLAAGLQEPVELLV